MLAVSIEAKAYAEIYRYATEILEDNPEDSEAWIAKGIAAANLFDPNATKVNESIVLVKKGIALGADKNTQEMAASHLLNGFENGINELNKIIKAKVIDYQKVAMPKDGSILIHAFGQSVNKVMVAKEMAPAIVQFITLLPIIFSLNPNLDLAQKIKKYFSDIEAHSSDFGDYLKNSDPGKLFFTEKSIFENQIKELSLDLSLKTEKNKKDGCFIATAATGSYNHPKVVLLRSFRDNTLKNTIYGRWFISSYYSISPPLAKIISKNKTLKLLTLWLIINPIYFIIRKINLNHLRNKN